MALVPCGECGKEVSTKAESCPGCGAPVGKTPRPPMPARQRKTSQSRVQAVEATGKKWKALQAVGGCSFLVFGTVFVIGLQGGLSPGAMGIAILGLLGATCVSVLGRLGAWWFHG